MRNLITRLDVAKRGPALVLQMVIRSQEICMAMGTQRLIAADGVTDIMTELKAYYAPEAINALYLGAAKFSGYRETAETFEHCSAHFDFLRKRASSRLGTGQTFPGPITAI